MEGNFREGGMRGGIRGIRDRETRGGGVRWGGQRAARISRI